MNDGRRRTPLGRSGAAVNTLTATVLIPTGAQRALRRGVVLPLVAGRAAAGLGLQGQHRHDLGLRPQGETARLQVTSAGPAR